MQLRVGGLSPGQLYGRDPQRPDVRLRSGAAATESGPQHADTMWTHGWSSATALEEALRPEGRGVTLR